MTPDEMQQLLYGLGLFPNPLPNTIMDAIELIHHQRDRAILAERERWNSAVRKHAGELVGGVIRETVSQETPQ